MRIFSRSATGWRWIDAAVGETEREIEKPEKGEGEAFKGEKIPRPRAEVVEKGWVFRLGAEVSVVGVEEGIQAEYGGHIELGIGKDAEGGPRPGA